jgi:hypothetical protein
MPRRAPRIPLAQRRLMLLARLVCPLGLAPRPPHGQARPTAHPRHRDGPCPPAASSIR